MQRPNIVHRGGDRILVLTEVSQGINSVLCSRSNNPSIQSFLGVNFNFNDGFIQLLYTTIFLYSSTGFQISFDPYISTSLFHNSFPIINLISIYDKLCLDQIRFKEWGTLKVTYFRPMQPRGPRENGLLAPNLSVVLSRSNQRSGRKT